MHKWSIEAVDKFEMWLRHKEKPDTQYLLFLVGPLKIGDIAYDPIKGWDGSPLDQEAINALSDAICCYAVARPLPNKSLNQT